MSPLMFDLKKGMGHFFVHGEAQGRETKGDFCE